MCMEAAVIMKLPCLPKCKINFPNLSSEEWVGHLIIIQKSFYILYRYLPKKLMIVEDGSSYIWVKICSSFVNVLLWPDVILGSCYCIWILSLQQWNSEIQNIMKGRWKRFFICICEKCFKLSPLKYSTEVRWWLNQKKYLCTWVSFTEICDDCLKEFRRKFDNDPVTTNLIIKWYEKFSNAGCIFKGRVQLKVDSLSIFLILQGL